MPSSPDATRSRLRATAARNTDSLTERIARTLAERIQSGGLQPGTRLQSVRGFARQSGNSVQTVLRAYDKLVALGYLEARRGSGFYVTQRSRSPAPLASSWVQASTLGQDWRQLLRADVLGTPHIGSGLLPESWFDQKALAAGLRSIGPTVIPALSSYAEPAGHPPLRQLLRQKLLEYGIEAPPAQILTSAGAAEALHLAIWSNFRPGDWVLIEDPCSPLHRNAMMANGLEIFRIPRLTDGPDIDALRAACVRYRPRGLLCSSLLHNPTSSNIAPNKAFQLLQLAEEFHLTLIDDCSYADLLPPSPLARPLPLAALDQLHRVVHVGSFSSTLGPSLRVGFMAVSTQQVERLLLFRSASTLGPAVLGERLVHHLLAQGKYRHHCERLQARLQDRRERLSTQLQARGFAPPGCRAGMYLWLSLGAGVNARAVFEAMSKCGQITAPAPGLFSASPEYESYMRLNVAVACDNPALDLLTQEVARARKPQARR